MKTIIYLKGEKSMKKELNEIIDVALERLDSVITEMGLTSSVTTQLGLSATAHDLIKIIKLAREADNSDNEEA